ncbi:hypothetical protein Adu01nite_18320 [Paractinoplanes durhamensis]|uniref:Uncharacterized protein n=1 Tax=Paractinoplanes durhamensis TaxID=113563 RepID=A0ABQ3YSB3_9ACTN|nr:hypothetical protein Adu01nite_18320 [Actinoplanes durhamensis]
MPKERWTGKRVAVAGRRPTWMRAGLEQRAAEERLDCCRTHWVIAADPGPVPANAARVAAVLMVAVRKGWVWS